MTYGIRFAMLALLLAATAVMNGGWWLALLWPAVSCTAVAVGYFGLGASVYGKSQKGLLPLGRQTLLLPLLGCLLLLWHLLRLVKREPAFHQLTENVLIGRRLLAHEIPAEVVHVIDLTCEFSEPEALRRLAYSSFPILDGHVPTAEQLVQWVDQVAAISEKIYVHCAEGHGRTGMFAAALLVRSGRYTSPKEALAYIKSKRPQVRLAPIQLAMLHETFGAND